MGPKDAYYGIDRLQAECEAIADHRDKWIALAIKNTLPTWEKQLRDDDLIDDLGFGEADIMRLALKAQISFNDQLTAMAHKQAAALFETLSWDEK